MIPIDWLMLRYTYYFRWFWKFGHLPKYHQPVFDVNCSAKIFLSLKFCMAYMWLDLRKPDLHAQLDIYIQKFQF